MKNAIIALLMVTTSMSVAYGQRSEGQSYFQYYTENDKLLHAGAGFAIAGLGTTMYATARPNEPLINAAGVGLLSGWAAGGLKELSDWKLGTGNADHGDVMATAKGAALGAFTTAFSIKLSRNWNDRRVRKNRVVAVDLATGKKVRLR